MERPLQELQRAPDGNSGRTKQAQLYQLLGLRKYVFPLVCVIVAGYWVTVRLETVNRHAWEMECLRRDRNVSDMALTLQYWSLASQLEEERYENLRLKDRVKSLQQRYKIVVQDAEKRVNDLQMYRESEIERKEKEKHDVATFSENLKSQLENKGNELVHCERRETELQAKYDAQRDKGRRYVEEIQSCQADTQSRRKTIQDLKKEKRVTQGKHKEEIQAEQKRRKDELGEKEKAIGNLNQRIRDKETKIQTLISEVDNEKRRREIETAQCDRKLQDARSTQDDGGPLVGFVAGIVCAAFGIFCCIAYAGGKKP